MGNNIRKLALAATLAAASLATCAAYSQRRAPFPEPPAPARQQNPAEPGPPSSQRAAHAQLLQNERDFRAGVDRLYQLATELREEVQKTPGAEILSVRTFKKTEEIEKLAKQLKSKSKG